MATTINITNEGKLRPWSYVAKDIIAALNAVETGSIIPGSDSHAGVVYLSNDYSSTDAAALGVAGETAATPKAVYDAFEAAKAYTDTAVTSVYRFKGSVNTVADLPAAGTEGLTVGDVYNVKQAIDGNSGEDGVNYAWTGTGWDSLGGILSVESVLNGTTGASGAPVSASAVKTYVDGEVSTLDARITSEVSTLNATIESEVSALEASIASEVSTLNEVIASNVSTLNERIDSEVSALNATIESEVSALNETIESEVSALQAQIDEIVDEKTITIESKEAGSTTTITKDSDQVIVMNTNGAQTLAFTAAASTVYSVKYIHLTAATDTVLTVTGAEWADAAEQPVWGKQTYKLYLRVAFVAGRVTITVLDNSQEAYNVNQYTPSASTPEPVEP